MCIVHTLCSHQCAPPPDSHPLSTPPPLYLLNSPLTYHPHPLPIHTQAALCPKGSTERLVWLSAFAISGYSGTINRTSKPFNPLLGETYELLYQEKVCWGEGVGGGHGVDVVNGVGVHSGAGGHSGAGVRSCLGVHDVVGIEHDLCVVCMV